jgi:hypothetical protein
MKSQLKSFLFAVGLLAPGATFADEQVPPHRPCLNIVAACRAAGYEPHAQEKNLRRDFVKPILTGGSVEGVTVDSNDVQACLSRIAAHPRK